MDQEGFCCQFRELGKRSGQPSGSETGHFSLFYPGCKQSQKEALDHFNGICCADTCFCPQRGDWLEAAHKTGPQPEVEQGFPKQLGIYDIQDIQ